MVIPTSFSSSFNALSAMAVKHTTALLPYLMILFPQWSIYILIVQMSCSFPLLKNIIASILCNTLMTMLRVSLAPLYHTVKIGVHPDKSLLPDQCRKSYLLVHRFANNCICFDSYFDKGICNLFYKCPCCYTILRFALPMMPIYRPYNVVNSLI